MSKMDFFNNHPRVKSLILNAMMNKVECRPRFWLRRLRPFYCKRGAKSKVYCNVRMDVTPFHPFSLGRCSVIESFSCVNNAVGAVTVGDNSRVGLHNTLIGPVSIGGNVIIAQGVVISGLNHNYESVDTPIAMQGVNTAQVSIADDVWIGANATVTQGVSIGTHSVVGAGSVVTTDIPPYCVAVGVPARVVRRYDTENNVWVKVPKNQ